MKKVLLFIAMMVSMTSFAQKKLVLYFSESGSTKAVAEELQKQLGADLESILPEEPYSGNFQETMQRVQRENQNGTLPKIKPLQAKIADYDIIFLGYPIWGGTYASPVTSLLKEQDFAGKKIVPFCTFGSGGLETSADALKKALPKAEILAGYGVRAARVAAAAKELDRFLKENGYKKGSVKALPAYSAQQPVTDAEKAIFNAACSSYQFNLGTPETFGKRTTDDSIDYEFKVKSQGFGGGGTQTSTIYVTMGKEEGAKPEFTRVVR
jgi:flavodoxin